MIVKLFCTVLLLLTAICQPYAQSSNTIDEEAFFREESVMEVKIITNLKLHRMKDGQKYTAIFEGKLSDSSAVREQVTLEVRGHYRKDNCELPPLKIGFKTSQSSRLSTLGSLKLVNVCKPSKNDHTEYLLKEYLVYKMYNLLTEKSLRVRLLKVRYTDSSEKRKFDQYAFLLEDVKDMAKRNNCVERKRPVKHTELTDRKQMTKVALFEYMIANLDWSVPAAHNIKLIVSKKDTNTLAFPVPYDFDHSGFVNTDYALPPPQVAVQNVTERNYRGFSRDIAELEEAANEFLKQKQNIYALINDFNLISLNSRKLMIRFLDEFFSILSNQNKLKTEFIQNARKG